MTKGVKRLTHIDIAKGICIILVVIGHYIPDNAPDWYRLINRFIYTFHMPLFMFASGYVYIATKKDVSYGEFLKKKFLRLLVPYFSTSIIVITIKLLTQNNMYVQNPVSLLSYLKILYQPEAGYFLWFIWALWWMFVIVPLFKTKNSRLLLFIVTLIMSYIPFGVIDIFCFNELKRFFVYFMLGVVIYDNKEVLSKRVKISNWIPVISFICVDFICLLTNGGILSFLRNMVPFLGIWAVLIISSKLEIFIHKKIFSWLLIVSASSYLIYLFHTTFEGFAKAVIQKVPFMNDNGGMFFVLGVFIVVICGVLCPIVLHRCFLDKTKITRFLFGLK